MLHYGTLQLSIKIYREEAFPRCYRKQVSAIHLCLCLRIVFLRVCVSFCVVCIHIYVTHTVTHAYTLAVVLYRNKQTAAIESNGQSASICLMMCWCLVNVFGVWLCWQHNNSNRCEIRFRSHRLINEKLRVI